MEARTRSLGLIGPGFDAAHAAGEFAEGSREIAATGADFEYAIVHAGYDGLHDAARDFGLQHVLAGAERNGQIRIGE